jgi:hypothetical protein
VVVLIQYLPHNRLEEIGGLKVFGVLAGLSYIDPPLRTMFTKEIQVDEAFRGQKRRLS